MDLPRHGSTRVEAQLGQIRKSFPDPVPGGYAGVNVSGVDPLTGQLALWSVGRNFMGKNGRWDEMDKNVLGQVQGSSRLVREFPNAKTYKAHWQQLKNGSFVDDHEKGYTAKFVEEKN